MAKVIKKKSSSKEKGDVYSKYKPMSKEKLQKSSQTLGTRGLDTMKLKEGSNLMRFLPNPNSDRDEFYIDVALHWSLGIEENRVAVSRTFYGKKCRIEAFVKSLYEALEKKDWPKESKKYKEALNAIKKIGKQRRVYAYVLDPADMKTIKKVSLSVQTMQECIDASIEEHEADVLSDVREGVVVNIKRKGTGLMDTKYKCYLKNKLKVPVDVLAKLDELPSLEESLSDIPDSELDEILEETKQRFVSLGLLKEDLKTKKKKTKHEDIDEDEDDDDGDESDDDIDDEEDEEDIDDDDEDDESDDDDDDEESDDDEEDDEDEDDDSDDGDNDAEDEDEDDEDDLDDDDEDDEIDDDEEEEEKPKKKTNSKLKDVKSRLQRRKK